MRRTLLLALVLGVAACGSGTSEESPDPETTTTAAVTTTEAVTTTAASSTPNLSITIAAFRFSGDETGSVGDTVQVTNNDTVGHTWTATEGAFHSGVLSEGDQFTHTFEEAGTYDFFCQIHTDMTGSITIEG